MQVYIIEWLSTIVMYGIYNFIKLIIFVESFMLYYNSFFAKVKNIHSFNIPPPSKFIVSVTTPNCITLNSIVTYGSDIRGKAELFEYVLPLRAYRNVMEATPSRPGRKKRRVPGEWAQNRRKILRNTGAEYVGVSRKVV